MKRFILLVSLCLLTQFAWAQQNKACNALPTLLPFKAGMDALAKKQNELAFDIFCNLAFRGDYRAQFKLAQFYGGDIESNYEQSAKYAFLWSGLSNKYIKSTRRHAFFEQISERMSTEQRQEAEVLLAKAKESIPSGVRIDQFMKPVDMEKIIAKYREEVGGKVYTGSRIKREKPPLDVSVFQLN